MFLSYLDYKPFLGDELFKNLNKIGEKINANEKPAKLITRFWFLLEMDFLPIFTLTILILEHLIEAMIKWSTT